MSLNSASYATATERQQAATEALQVRKALEDEMRAADDIAREHNALHNRFRPRSRSGRQVAATLRKAMPKHAQAAADTAGRLREQRRILNKIADILTCGADLDPLLTGAGLNGVDLTAAPTLARFLGRRRQAHADHGDPVTVDPVSARRAALHAQIGELMERADRILAERQRRC